MADQNRLRPEQHIECIIEGIGDVKLSAKLKEIRHDRVKLSSADSIPEHATITLVFDNSRYQLNASVEGYVSKARNNPTVGKCYATVDFPPTSRIAAMELYAQVEALGHREQNGLAEIKFQEARRHELDSNWAAMHSSLKHALALNPMHQEARRLYTIAYAHVRKRRLKMALTGGSILLVILVILGVVIGRARYHRSEFERLLAQAQQAFKDNEHQQAHNYINEALQHEAEGMAAKNLRAQLVPVSLAESFGLVQGQKDFLGNRVQQGIDSYTGLPWEILHKPTRSHFILIPAGTFKMGGDDRDDKRRQDEVQHTVNLTKPFYLGKYEATRHAFSIFVAATKYKTEAELKGGGLVRGPKGFEEKVHARWSNPYYEQSPQHPVTLVSWNDVQQFLKWMDDGRKRIRLPTEAEWEYACRGRSIRRFYWGQLEKFASTNANVSDKTAHKEFIDWPFSDSDDKHIYTATGEGFVSNEFNLFHMSGNVAEWCSDWYGKYNDGIQTDPKGAVKGTDKVVRGGHFASSIYDARSASREFHPPDYRSNVIGFRMAVTVQDEELK